MMIESLYRRCIIPAFESGWQRRGTFRYLRQLEESQWLSTAELQARQLVSLRKLLCHAANHCSYYRQQWQPLGLDPNAIESLDDVRAWPLIDRSTIQQHRMTMRSDQPGLQLIHKATGGSSGVPLQFDLDLESNDRRMAAWHRGYAWAGAGLGTKQFYLWGSAIGDQPRKKQLKDQIYHWIYRRKIVSCFGMSDARVGEFLQQLNRHRPDAIVAYTNPLYFFARALQERGEQPYTPRSIVVGAEKLHDFQRALIERVFQAPVFETYGSREFMLIGAECDQHAGLHLTMENLLVEVVNDDGSPTPEGQEGNLVVTDLTNYGMPFVRYLNGDRAIAGWTACRCGRGLPLLRQVVGRRLDTLRTPDGRMVPGEFFPHFLKDFPVVRRFQVVQHSLGNVELKVVCGGPWQPGDRETITQTIESLMGDQVDFQIDEVDEIPLTSAGKLRVVVSHCGQPDPPSAAV